MSPALFATIVAVHYRIDVALDLTARRLEGRAGVELRNDSGAPLPELWLWTYPNRLGEAPTGLDDVSYHWVYPKEFEPAWMRVHDLTVDGEAVVTEALDQAKAGKRTLLRVILKRPLSPGGQAHLDMGFEVGIPVRYGAFGCASGVCTLMQGWHPMIAAGGPADQAMPPRADYDVRVRSPWATVIDGQIGPSVSLRDALYVPLIAFQEMRALEVEHRGVRIRYLSRFAPIPSSDRRVPYGLENFYRIGSDAARQALDLLADLGLPLPRQVTLCEAPLRHEIAQAHPGLVLVSDRAWRLLPLERFRKFHSLQIARALFASAIEERARAFEDPRDLAWAPDAAAVFLVEVLTVSQYGGIEYARDVLRYFSFVPDIDALIYAPKVAFSSAYFGAVEDPDRLRDDLRRFNNDLPRGKRVYEKLKDLLGAPGVIQTMRSYLRDGVPLRRAAEQAAGRPLGEFFAQWLGAYPYVHYEVVGVESVLRGRKHLHRVSVRKHGTVVEPVTLWARDRGGAEITMRWDGRGRSHEFLFYSRAPLDVAYLDPKERLVENWPQRRDDLRFDNRQPPRWKLLLYRFEPRLDVVERDLGVLVDFTLRRVYDLRNSFRFAFFRTAVTEWGASVGASRAFGDLVDDNRLATAAGVGVSAARLNERFALAVGMDPRPGTRLGISLGLGHDNRLWLLDPDRGWGLGVGVGAQTTVLDDGESLWTGSGGALATKLFRLMPGHTLAAQVSAGAIGGDIELHSQLVGVGGAGGLIGYQSDELLARGAAVLAIEYRHMFVRGLDWNVLHLARGRALGGAVFANAATLSSCETLAEGWSGGDAFFDAGYSFRAYFDQLGVSPALFRADIGIPLNRHSRRCAAGGFEIDSATTKRPPIGLVLSFAPPF